MQEGVCLRSSCPLKLAAISSAHIFQIDVPDKQVHKDHAAVKQIYDWVNQEFENGRVTSVSDDELVEMVKKHLPDIYKEKAVKTSIVTIKTGE